MKPTLSKLLGAITLLFAFLESPAVHADPSQRAGYHGDVSTANPISCASPAGSGPKSFLNGINQNETNRIIGVTISCVGTAHDGHGWAPGDMGAQPPTRVGAPAGQWQAYRCPQDSFVVGLDTSFGSYSANTPGLAAVSFELIAELGLICRGGRDNAIHVVSVSHLTGTDNNRITTRPWDGDDGARTCPRGQAATGLEWNFDSKRDADPGDQFLDVALVCDQLPSKAAIGPDVVRKPRTKPQGIGTVPPPKQSPLNQVPGSKQPPPH
jgi:hypothetical protein